MSSTLRKFFLRPKTLKVSLEFNNKTNAADASTYNANIIINLLANTIRLAADVGEPTTLRPKMSITPETPERKEAFGHSKILEFKDNKTDITEIVNAINSAANVKNYFPDDKIESLAPPDIPMLIEAQATPESPDCDIHIGIRL